MVLVSIKQRQAQLDQASAAALSHPTSEGVMSAHALLQKDVHHCQFSMHLQQEICKYTSEVLFHSFRVMAMTLGSFTAT